MTAIDRPASPHIAQVTLDWVDRFTSDDPRRRFRTADPRDWTTLFPADLIRARIVARRSLAAGTDLAVGIALTNDVTDDVIAHVQDHDLPVDMVLILGPGGEPGPTAVPSNGWLTAWTRKARETIVTQLARPGRVHLFMSAPASAALMLGHTWNAVPAPTTVYDFDGRVYFPCTSRRSSSADPRRDLSDEQ